MPAARTAHRRPTEKEALSSVLRAPVLPAQQQSVEQCRQEYRPPSKDVHFSVSRESQKQVMSKKKCKTTGNNYQFFPVIHSNATLPKNTISLRTAEILQSWAVFKPSSIRIHNADSPAASSLLPHPIKHLSCEVVGRNCLSAHRNLIRR